MEIERQYRDGWVIPQMCCACGEPSANGKPRPATVTLGRGWIRGGFLNGTGGLKTTSLTLEFPRCARCGSPTRTLSDRLLARAVGEDRRRRVRRSDSPVSITLKEAHNYAPLLKFRFANERYGKAFSEQNS